MRSQHIIQLGYLSIDLLVNLPIEINAWQLRNKANIIFIYPQRIQTLQTSLKHFCNVIDSQNKRIPQFT